MKSIGRGQKYNQPVPYVCRLVILDLLRYYMYGMCGMYVGWVCSRSKKLQVHTG